MYLLKRLKILPIRFFLILTAILLMAIDTDAFPNSSDVDDFVGAFSKALEEGTHKNRYLLKKWDEYLAKINGHTNADYLSVLEELTNSFRDLFVTLNEKMENDSNNDKKKYNSDWLIDLEKRFGKNFIRKNRKAIIDNLWAALNRNESKRYDAIAKDLIYQELVLYGSYREYLEDFTLFFKKLQREEQQKLHSVEEVSEKFLHITKTSHFASIYNSTYLKRRLIEVEAKKNKSLYTYFQGKAYPYGNSVSMKAVEDLEVYIENSQPQKQDAISE